MSNKTIRVLLAMSLVFAVANVGRIGRVSADPAGMPAVARAAAVKLAVGRTTACLVASSRVYCWGKNENGRIGSSGMADPVKKPTLVPDSPTDAIAVTLGKDHGCILRASGQVTCFGRNDSYQLGTTSIVSIHTLASPTDFTQIAAGDDFTCGLSTASGVVCWGNNSGGSLGGVLGADKAVTARSATPLAINMGGDSVTAIAAGGYNVCALLDSTKLKCWGDNAVGQLGDGYGNNMNDSTLTPEVMGRVPHYVLTSGNDQSAVGTHLSGVAAVSVGVAHVCAILDSGEARCWGAGSEGQLAGGAANNVQLMPGTVRVAAAGSAVTGLKGVSAGTSNTCFVRQTGLAACSGGNTYGAIGDGTSGASNVFVPTNVKSSEPGMTDVSSVGVGTDFACALTSAGRVYCWGFGTNGQIGNDQTSTINGSPTAVAGAVVQTISVTVPSSKTIDDGSFTVSGSSTSGTTVTFTSQTPSVCAVGGLTVTIVNVGTCTIRASAGASGIYVAAEDVDSSITVSSVAPRATTGVVSDLTTTSVTLAGSVNARGSSTTASFVYGTSASLNGVVTTVALSVVTGVTDVAVTTALTGLIPAVTYYYRLDAESAQGRASGEIRSFTAKGAKPTVTTGAATPETFSATLAGEVNANEVDATVSFEYGTDQTLTKSETASVTEAVTGSTAKAVSASVAKLSPGTTYYYRVVATNSVGTTRGDIKSFATKGSRPTAATGSATRGSAGMTVNGKANPKDLETTVRFEYGTDSKLAGAQQTAAKVQVGSDDVDVSAVISGLAENTTYYYRIVATNVVGTAEGDIKSFTTTRPEGVSINDGEEFTSSENVIVSVVGPPTAVKAILSNDGGFKTSETFDLTNNSADINWKLQSSREGTFTKIVYVKYISRFGSQSQAESDDIILDTTKPVMSAATATAAAPTGSAVQVARTGRSAKGAAGGVRLSLRGSDTISGIGFVEVRSASNKPATKVTVSRVAGKTDGKPRATSQTVTLRTSAKRLQVRVIDRAGNASAWRAITVR